MKECQVSRRSGRRGHCQVPVAASLDNSLALQQLRCQSLIRARAATMGIVLGNQLAVARSLAQANIPGDEGIEDALWKETADFLDDLLRQVDPAIVHCHNDTTNMQPRVETLADKINRLLELC